MLFVGAFTAEEALVKYGNSITTQGKSNMLWRIL